MATLNDAKYACTVSSIWVCMIEGRFLVGGRGNTAWKRKSDAAVAFKHSEYWSWIVDGLKNSNPDQVEESKFHRWWKYGGQGKDLEEQAYKELIESGKLKYIEITPIPEWVNL